MTVLHAPLTHFTPGNPKQHVSPDAQSSGPSHARPIPEHEVPGALH
jgi:hypothetical protein